MNREEIEDVVIDVLGDYDKALERLSKIENHPREFKPKRLVESTYGEGFHYIDQNGKTHFVKYEDDFDSQAIDRFVNEGGKEDVVNQPNHYTFSDKFEVIDIVSEISKQYPPELAFAIGNVVKYVARSQHKNGLQDLEKAAYYLNYVIDNYKEE